MASTSFINNFYKCCLCEVTTFPPLIGCANGHLTCSSCRYYLVVKKCPICRGGFTHQNGLERLLVSSNEKVVCANLGCNESTSYSTGFLHLLSCKFRPLICQLSGKSCQAEGPIQIGDLKRHLIQKHPEHSIPNPVDVITQGITIEFSIFDQKEGETSFKRVDFNGKQYFLSLWIHAAGYYAAWVISFPPIEIEEPVLNYQLEISPDTNKTNSIRISNLQVKSFRFQDTDKVEEDGKFAMFSQNFIELNNKFYIHIKFI